MFESEEDEDEGTIKAGGNKAGGGGFFACSTSAFLGIGGLWAVSRKPEGKHGSDQPILLLRIIISHRRRNTSFETGSPELGLESKYLVLRPLEVFPEFQVDLQSLFASFNVLS